VRYIEKRIGLDQDRPARIDLADVDSIEGKIRLRIAISDTAVAAVEQRLRTWVLRLPGAR
jgi:hypothetical protein